MALLIWGLVVLLGSHSLMALAPQRRRALRAALGKRTWAWAVSLVSTAALVLVVIGVRQMHAAPLVLYVPGPAAHWLARGLMLGVFPIVLSAWFPGRIAHAVRHPLPAGIALWAVAHLIANGMLHDAILFGSLLAWAALDAVSLARRGGLKLPGAPPAESNDAFVLVAGLVAYALVAFVIHATLFGVAPFGEWPLRRGA
jgi:uncharacterized membrane protein